MGISLVALTPSLVALSTLLTSQLVPDSTFHANNDLDSRVIEQRIEAKNEKRKPVPLKQFVPTPTPRPVVKVVKVVKPAEKQATQPQFGGSVADVIVRYANQFKVNPSIMLSIASCESGLRPNAANGPYAGIFQFNSSTWISNRRAMGLPTDPALRNNPEEAAKTAAFKMARDGFGAWPACSRKALASI